MLPNSARSTDSHGSPGVSVVSGEVWEARLVNSTMSTSGLRLRVTIVRLPSIDCGYLEKVVAAQQIVPLWASADVHETCG